MLRAIRGLLYEQVLQTWKAIVLAMFFVTALPASFYIVHSFFVEVVHSIYRFQAVDEVMAFALCCVVCLFLLFAHGSVWDIRFDFPRRLYTLPVRTVILATVALIYRLAVVVTVAVLFAILEGVHGVMEADTVGMFLLALLPAIAFMHALTCIGSAFGAMGFLVSGLAYLCFVGTTLHVWGDWLLSGPITACALSLALVILAWLVAVWAIGAARHGEQFPLSETVGKRVMERPARFCSGGSARYFGRNMVLALPRLWIRYRPAIQTGCLLVAPCRASLVRVEECRPLSAVAAHRTYGACIAAGRDILRTSQTADCYVCLFCGGI